MIRPFLFTKASDSIPTTKKFLRKLGVAATVRLAHTATLSFSDIAK